MSDPSEKHPSPQQRDFFENVIDPGRLQEESEAESTVLVLKHPCGPVVNIRGPFDLVEYRLPRDAKVPTTVETVIDARWAGAPESDAHLHLTWALVRYAKLEEANRAVQANIKHKWKLSLLNVAKEPLFWFYLKDDGHRAYVAFTKRGHKPQELVNLGG